MKRSIILLLLVVFFICSTCTTNHILTSKNTRPRLMYQVEVLAFNEAQKYDDTLQRRWIISLDGYRYEYKLRNHRSYYVEHIRETSNVGIAAIAGILIGAFITIVYLSGI